MKIEQTLWVEKYRPRKLEDLVLPEYHRNKMKGYIESRIIPNLLFSGPPGGGKCVAGEEMIEIWIEIED